MRVERRLNAVSLIRVGPENVPRLLEVSVWNAELQVDVLVDVLDALGVGNIEEVSTEAEMEAFRHAPQVVGMEVDGSSRGCAAKGAATSDWNFTTVEINGVRGQLGNWCPGLNSHAGAQRQVLHHAMIEEIAEV